MDWMTENWFWFTPAVAAVLVGLRQVVKKTKPAWDDKIVEGLSAIWSVFSAGRGKTEKK